MKPPSRYSDPLLFNYAESKHGMPKLTSEQKGVQKATARLIQHGLDQPTLANLIVVLGFTENNPRTANSTYRYYQLWQMAKAGFLIAPTLQYKERYSTMAPDIPLVGMDNWKLVLCYIDSLLVSMFYSSSSYDFLLDSTVDEDSTPQLQRDVEELKVMLRFIVNLLRSGEFVPSGVLEQLCLVLNSLGCDLAMSGRQQDTLQFFEFLSDSLSLPLLTMKLDIIHSGRMNLNDDLRIIQERVILISVPPHKGGTDKDKYAAVGPPVPLEDCLNNYFNNSVTVRRHIDQKRIRSASITEQPEITQSPDLEIYEKFGVVRSSENAIEPSPPPPLSSSPRSINILRPAGSHEDGSLGEEVSAFSGMSTSAFSGRSIDSIDRVSQVGSISKVSERMEASRTRSSTIVSVLNNVPVQDPSTITRRASSISNAEVPLPAWMFLQLLPYYTDPDIKLQFENHEELYRSRNSRSKTIDSIDPGALAELEATSKFAQRFGDRRPVVPVCLKRYLWDGKGKSHKVRRKVIVPEVMKYPYFIAEDSTKPGYVDFKRGRDNKAPCGSFLLVLESCVCHRGSAVDSGHYVSLTRKRPFDPHHPETDVNAKDWIIFNDLLSKGRKSKAISFKEAMQNEDPYLLFYRIVDIDDESIPEIKTEDGYRRKYWNAPAWIVTGTEEPDSRKQSVSSISDEKSAKTLQLSKVSTASAEDEKSVASKKSRFSYLVGRSSSKSSSRPAFNALEDVSPNEPFYLGVEDLYFWYPKDPTGSYVDRLESSAGSSVMSLSKEQIDTAIANEEAAFPGFMDKFNSSIFKRSASSSQGDHHRHHQKKEDNSDSDDSTVINDGSHESSVSSSSIAKEPVDLDPTQLPPMIPEGENNPPTGTQPLSSTVSPVSITSSPRSEHSRASRNTLHTRNSRASNISTVSVASTTASGKHKHGKFKRIIKKMLP